jgi:transposase
MNKPNDEVRILPQVEKACGLDMHKDKIVCFISNKNGKGQYQQEFPTFTEDLFRIRNMLLKHKVKHCLMESTGIYWVSLYGILTGAGIEVIVANPQHIKQIPKRKTDRKDAKWLCTLMLHGLARHSFVPNETQQVLRELCRNRLFYKQGQSKIKNRILKILERANIKIRSVVSNISIKTAMTIIRLLATGNTNIELLSSHCKGKLKTKKELMKKALQSTLTTAERQLLQMLLADMDHYQYQIDLLENRIVQLTEQSYKEVAECLQTISGVGPQTAQVILSEIGDDMSLFPTAEHLTSWCGVAPGNNESAGKRRNTQVKKGNKYLRVALITVAWAAVKTKDSYWKALFDKLRKRMKVQKAIVAVARRLLKVIYKVIKNREIYQEKGIAHFLDLQQHRLAYYRMKTASTI